MSVTKRGSPSGTERKSHLFCPDCERSAPMDEGWALNRREGRTEIDCPDCGTVLVSQPYSESESRSASLPA